MGSVGKWGLSSAGDGSFNASVFYMGETYATPEGIAHELGHNFGLSHASSVSALPESLSDPTDYGFWNDAGDTADTMGYTTGFQHFSSVSKSLCSWFDSSQVVDVTASGEYTLDQIEQPSAGVKVLRIPLGKDASGQDAYYWVEYRTPGTFDQEQGVQVRFQSAGVYNGSTTSNNSLRFLGVAAGGSISGKVVRQADGSSMPQVYVYLYDSSWRSVQSRVTDGGGRFAFRGLAAGSYFLHTYNYEGLTDEYYDDAQSQKLAVPAVVTQGQETVLKDIALAPGCSISGTITRESDGVPIQNTSVYAYDASYSFVRSTSTNSSGRFSLTGLAPGQYYLRAYNSGGSYGYVSTWYINATQSASAIPILLDPGARLKDIDFSMIAGGAISGQVKRESDGTGIQTVSVYAYDKNGNFVNGATTAADGRYQIKSLPPGDYFVRTYNSQGYINEYYRDVTTQSAATAVKVVQEAETGGIDFALAKSSPAATASGRRSRSDSAEGTVHPAVVQPTGWLPPSPGIQPEDAMPQLSVLATTELLQDPYRGVKIELLGTSGSGADAQAKVRVTLSKLRIDAEHTLSFYQLPIGGTQAKEVRVVNESPAPVLIGKPNISGRNRENFLINWDECSGTILAPGGSCKVGVTFAPVRYSGTSYGEFAVLRFPTDDALRPFASIALWGKALATDISVTAYQDSDFVVGQNGSYSIYISNYGTAAFSGTVTVTDKLPAGLRYVSSTTGWICSVSGQEVSCSRVLNLSPSYSLSMDITVAVTAEAAPQCMNSVTVTSSSDANPDNNTDVVSTSVDGGGGTVSYGPSLLSGDGMYTGVALYNAGTATAAVSITALDKNGAAL